MTIHILKYDENVCFKVQKNNFIEYVLLFINKCIEWACKKKHWGKKYCSFGISGKQKLKIFFKRQHKKKSDFFKQAWDLTGIYMHIMYVSPSKVFFTQHL